jgi:hypothetical protein
VEELIVKKNPLEFMKTCQSSINTKHPTKGKKKVQDERTQVLANKESSKEGKEKRVQNIEKTQVLTNPKNAPKNVDR